MKKDVIRILSINPGSTSTKIGVFDNEKCVLRESISHSVEELEPFKEIADQKDFREDVIIKVLQAKKIPMESIDAFAGRGGGLVSCAGGTYEINPIMYKHAKMMYTVKHPSALGITIAYELGQKYDKPSFCVNPPDVDEFITEARITGIPEIYRESRIHALNQKEIGIRYAKKIGKKYKDLNLIICHLGGGISITAHNHGKMIDSNDIVNGDGPMAPTRSGFVPAKALAKLCFSNKYTEKEIYGLIGKNGGLMAWLGTNDIREILARVKKGDQKAQTIVDAMVYQIAKQVGAMYVALKCNCSAIILTGGISNDSYVDRKIKKYISKLAPVVVMPGEFELEALAAGALRVMKGEEKTVVYTGKPVFKEL